MRRLLAEGPRREIRLGGDLYLERIYVAGPLPPRLAALFLGAEPVPNPAGEATVYLHRIHRPDADRCLHNHPWRAMTTILQGGYTEVRAAPGGPVTIRRRPGDTAVLELETFHRIAAVEPGCLTLFLTGAYAQPWGFATPEGFVPHWDREDQG